MALTYNGQLVPWVTRWTGQVVDEQIAVAPGPKLGYTQDDAQWRDANGVLWQKEASNFDGEPEFSQVSTIRQSLAMIGHLCQVCGERVEGDIKWIMRDDQFWDGLTISPPTCERCITIASNLCPALQGGYRTFLVRKFSIVGYWGGHFDFARRTWVSSRRMLGDPRGFDNFIAKQIVVRFDDYEEIATT